MMWGRGTRRAIAAAASTAFCLAAADHALAQQQDAPQETQQDASQTNTLPAVRVNASADNDDTVGLVARRSRTGTKTDTPIDEIPQTINVVTSAQIEETGATTINEALRYVPGFSSYGSDVRSDWYSALRGFTPTVFVDGLQVPNTLNLSSWRVDPYMVDSITILRGPTSVLYGQGDPGAIVDVQSKLADGGRYREAGVQIGNYARKQVMFDIGDKIDKDGTWSYRVLAVGRDGNSMTGPHAEQRFAISPSVRWQPSASTSLTIAASYLQDWGDASNNFLPAQGTVLPNPNGKISPDLYTGDPTYSYYRKKEWSIGYQFEHKFNDIWTFRQNTRWMHLSLDNGAVWGAGLDPSDPTEQTLARYAGLFQPNYSRFDIDNQAQARFGTGPLEHTVLLGFEYNRQNSTDSEWLALGPSLNMYNPVYTPVSTAIFSGPDSFGQTDTRTTLDTFGLYAQDQVKWNRWMLTIGGREDWSHTKQDDIVGGTQLKQDDSAFTGRVGMTYLGDYGLSPYISYSTSFNPIIGVKMADGSLPAPTRGRQIEAGLRWQPPGKNLMLGAAVYQINQTNVLTPDPTDPTGTFSVQTGEVRSRGIELSAVGNVTRNLSVIAAYVYQDVKNISANDVTLDKWPVSIPLPRQMASLWADWTWHSGPLDGLGFGAGIRYQSGLAGAADNSLYVPSYTVYDAAVHYDMPHWRFAVNASNIFNRTFVSGCQSDSACFYGNPRTVIASARYNW
ncbi:iron uptake receptor [Caballeronia calidae]|uniref:Iron uptake receptor n=1 Tax=Caballeronia calidae TaxID=1777139 RepID=A0A158DFI6_9BURK|nr:TonB-dependent siderophore receptor [Caballeronia calidae]SAK93334.1 iron uptake receptor [Caballeronia calidae]